jgi:hypothetical protein
MRVWSRAVLRFSTATRSLASMRGSEFCAGSKNSDCLIKSSVAEFAHGKVSADLGTKNQKGRIQEDRPEKLCAVLNLDDI